MGRLGVGVVGAMRTFTCAYVNDWKQPVSWWTHLLDLDGEVSPPRRLGVVNQCARLPHTYDMLLGVTG